MHETYRSPNPTELALLKKLLERNFPGRDELSLQLDGLSVKTIDQEGSLSLKPAPKAARAEVQQRVVAEGFYSDEDKSSGEGPQVNVLLHVVEGRLKDARVLEIRSWFEGLR